MGYTVEKLIEELQKIPKDKKVFVLDKEGEPEGVESISIIIPDMTLSREEVVLLRNY